MRIFSILLLCCLLCGCAKVNLPDIPTVTAPEPVEKLWQPVTLADTGECLFRVESCDLTPNGDYLVNLVCQNRSGGAEMFTCENWCVDGWQILPFWGEAVAPGEERTFQVALPRQTMEKCGIAEPKSLCFDLRIFSQANLHQNYLVSTRCALYPTGEKPGNILAPEAPREGDDMVLADNNGCAMTITDFRRTADFYEVDCLLENKTRQSMMFWVSGLVFNGVESEQVWAMKLTPGTKCAATLLLDLPRTAGYVRQLDMNLYICNCDEWFGRVWAQEQFRLKPPWEVPQRRIP